MPPSHLPSNSPLPVQPLPSPCAAPPDAGAAEDEEEEDDDDDDEFASASEWDADEKRTDGELQEDGGGGPELHRKGPGARDAVAAPEAADSGPAAGDPSSPTAAAAAGSDRRTPPDSGTGSLRGATATSTAPGTSTEPSAGQLAARLAASKKKKTANEQPDSAVDAPPGDRAQGSEKNAPPSPSGEPSKEVKSSAQAQKSPQSDGGWGGWGWGILKSVTQELENPNLDSLVNKASSFGGNLRAAAARTVDNVYEALDPEYGKEKEVLRSASKVESPPTSASEFKEGPDDAPKSAGSTSSPIREHASDVTAEVKRTASIAAESVLQTFDKTFDFASNALGTAFLGGYRKLEEANLREKFGYLQQEVASSEVAQVGENVVHTGLGALEALGRRAAEIVNEDRRRVLRESRMAKAGLSTEGQRASLDLCFEDNCGRAHLQALSMLAAECETKVASEMQSVGTGEGGPRAVETANAANDEMAEMFDSGSLLGELEEFQKSPCLVGAGADQAAASLQELGVSSSPQLRQLQAMMRDRLNLKEAEKEKLMKALQDISRAGNDSSPKESAKEVVLGSLAQIQASGVRAMADFAEKSCEQMLRVAEVLLMRVAEDKIMNYGMNGKALAVDAAGDSTGDGEGEHDSSESQTKEKSADSHASIVACAKSVRRLTVILLTDLQYLSTMYVQAAAHIVQVAKEQAPPTEAGAQKRDSELHDLCHQLLVDAGRAMIFVQEATQSNLPILKLILLQRLSNEKAAAAAETAAEAAGDGP